MSSVEAKPPAMHPPLETRPCSEPARVNLGSVRRDAGTGFYAPEVAWVRPALSERGRLFHLGPSGIVLETWREEPNAEYYDCVDHQVAVLAHEDGSLRWQQAGVPLAVAGELICLSPDATYRRGVVAARMSDGARVWQRTTRFERPEYCATPQGLYTWPSQDPDWVRQPFELAFWPFDGSPEQRLEGLPNTHFGYLRYHTGRLAIHQWYAKPRVHSDLRVLEVDNDHRLLWQHREEEYRDSDLFPWSGGWLWRRADRTLAYGPTGEVEWEGPGLTRCWLGANYLVGIRPDEEVVALDLASGAEQPLHQGRVWDLAISGPTVWLATRPERALIGYHLEGHRLWSGPQPARDQLGGYGYDTLTPLGSRLYAVGDYGAVVCLEGEGGGG